MTTAFHAGLYGYLIEVKSYLKIKKLHRMNQGNNVLRGSFNNRHNIRVPIQFRTENNS